jgi:hypothetical protein
MTTTTLCGGWWLTGELYESFLSQMMSSYPKLGLKSWNISKVKYSKETSNIFVFEFSSTNTSAVMSIHSHENSVSCCSLHCAQLAALLQTDVHCYSLSVHVHVFSFHQSIPVMHHKQKLVSMSWLFQIGAGQNYVKWLINLNYIFKPLYKKY